MIYLASYMEMTSENRSLLEEYVNSYSLAGMIHRHPADPGNMREGPPMLELSTFYSVAITDDGQVLKVDTADVSSLDEDQLTTLAKEIIAGDTTDGIRNHLIYRVADKGGYMLVAFLDNTLMLESASTLISYTLGFGGIVLILLFFMARYMARKIVAPLEESDRKQKQFVSDAGHELKTPLAVISANLDLAMREHGEDQWLRNIRYENDRMSALVTQLLALARAENVKAKRKPLDLSQLVYGEALPFESVAYEEGKDLRYAISDSIWIDGDESQLKQLVSILIDNALHHGIGKHVQLQLSREKHLAVLRVTNEGELISPEERHMLFERFYRQDDARSQAGGHYGLGLSIAKAIADEHKGTISVNCQDGEITFMVAFPALRKKS